MLKTILLLKKTLHETIQSLSPCFVRNNCQIRIHKKSLQLKDFYKAGLNYLGDSKESLRTFQYWVCKGVNSGILFKWMSLINAVQRILINTIKGKGLASIKRNIKFDVTKIHFDRNILSFHIVAL